MKELDQELGVFLNNEGDQQLLQAHPAAQHGDRYTYPHRCAKKTDVGKSSLLLTYHAQCAEGRIFIFNTSDDETYQTVSRLPRVVLPNPDRALGKGSAYLSMVQVCKQGAEREVLYVYKALGFDSAEEMDQHVKRAYDAAKQRESRKKRKAAAQATQAAAAVVSLVTTAATTAAATLCQQVAGAQTPAAALPQPAAISSVTPHTSMQSTHAAFGLSQDAGIGSTSSHGQDCSEQAAGQHGAPSAGVALGASAARDAHECSDCAPTAGHRNMEERRALELQQPTDDTEELGRVNKKGRVAPAGQGGVDGGREEGPAASNAASPASVQGRHQQPSAPGELEEPALAVAAGSVQNQGQVERGLTGEEQPVHMREAGPGASLSSGQVAGRDSVVRPVQHHEGHETGQQAAKSSSIDDQAAAETADSDDGASNDSACTLGAAAGAPSGISNMQRGSNNGSTQPERCMLARRQACGIGHGGTRQLRTRAAPSRPPGVQTGLAMLLRAINHGRAAKAKSAASSKPARIPPHESRRKLGSASSRTSTHAAPGPPSKPEVQVTVPACALPPAEGQLLRVNEDGSISIRASMLRGDKISEGSLGACICSLGIEAFCPANSDLALQISAEESEAVGRYGRVCGGGIFDKEKRNAKGGLVYAKDANGVLRLQMDSGNLRKQVPLDVDDSLVQACMAVNSAEFTEDLVWVYGEPNVELAEADERMVSALKKRLEPAAKELALQCAQQLAGSHAIINGATLLKQCVAIVNDWHEDSNGALQSCPNQTPHHDLRKADGHVLIWATDSVQLLWWPLTHCAIQAEQTCDKMSKHDKKLFFDHILPSRYPCVRLWLERDDVVALRGTTGHAGVAGEPGKPAGRLHWYAVTGPVGDYTEPLADSSLAGKVHLPSSQQSMAAREAVDLTRDGGGSSSHSSNIDAAYTAEALDADERTALMGWYRAIQIEDEELWCSDLVDISKGRWLRGHVMSAAFHLLQREKSKDRCAFLKADFASMFTDGKGKVKDEYTQIEWPKAEAALLDVKIQKLIIPVQVLTSHWACICFDKQDWAIHCWDSMQALPGGKQFLARFMQHLRQWLVENSSVQMLKEQDIRVVLHEEVSQQQNNIDCGMFTIGYAVAAALNKPATCIQQPQASALRLKLVYAIRTMSATKLVEYVEQQ